MSSDEVSWVLKCVVVCQGVNVLTGFSRLRTGYNGELLGKLQRVQWLYKIRALLKQLSNYEILKEVPALRNKFLIR